MVNRTPCRFFAGGNCRNGNNCRFLHESNAQGSPTVGSPNTRPVGTLYQAAPTLRSPDAAPRQVCNMYWQMGSCDRGFECSFKHTRDQRTDTDQPTPSAGNPDDDIPDFYSLEGLAATSGSNRTHQHNYNPSEVHNHIKLFLRDNYTFEGPLKVQGFVQVISSVNDRNKSWNSDDAQSFLGLLVKDSGIIRIGEVLRFKPVNDHVVNNMQNLSFQRGYFPLLEYFASNLVLKSTWNKNINHLYTVVEDNYDDIHRVLQSCVGSMIARNSWKDQGSRANLDGATVFKTISTVLFQFFNRFKSAIRNHPEIVDLVQDLIGWFDTWVTRVTVKPPLFDDIITELDPRPRELIIEQIGEDIDRLVTIVQRESKRATTLKRPTARPTVTAAHRRAAEIMRFGQTYDPPGDLRAEGPRHDNDFSDISQIRIAPTHEVLLSGLDPYLPVFLPEAPHHLPEDSMERHLDIQFRLLREELISTVRSSINAIHHDLREAWESHGHKSEPTKLETLLAQKGGAYKASGHDSVFFFVYTGVGFAPVRAERRDLTVGLLLDAPPGGARDPDVAKRFAYWKGSRRLQGGGLVALVIVSRGTLKFFLGLIASFGGDIAESSKISEDEIHVRIKFFDPEVEFRALRRENLSQDASSYAVLVDSSVMFEASRPFLERLQSIEPTEIPFGHYISCGGPLSDVQVKPPRYATDPRFRYNLQCLSKDSSPLNLIGNLDISQQDAVNTARHQLLRSSTLDPSQVDAVINTLTREVSLIQGPPGTGKSFTGREILRVLFASKIRPIVLIAYTNHALDHMLTEVLDAKITKNFVRLGSRSADERIAEFTLDKLEETAERDFLHRFINLQYRFMKDRENKMNHVMEIMESIQLPTVSAQKIEAHLEIHHPEHKNWILSPPYWICQLAENMWADEEEHGVWITIEGKQKLESVDNSSRTFYGLWKSGADITFLSPLVNEIPSELRIGSKGQSNGTGIVGTAQEDAQATQFFLDLGFGSQRPPIPTTNRPLFHLMNDPAVWKMSLSERTRLSLAWEEAIRKMAYEVNLDLYNELRDSYKEACKEYNEIRDEARRRLLSEVDLIACTTTGAAKLTSLISSIAPRVLMVEEAGQVLEAHILTSLVGSIHHLICIGDPQQLRPNLATFALSMDSERGKQLFKFDRSLMERLADSGLPMTQLNVQRRMRPTISHFIRQILYPNLEDNDIVKVYPPVEGMQKDVYFLNHTNPEDGLEDEDSVSKYNTYEVQMIRDLVLYFLKQDMYSGPGDIAVLCAYLGQLQKVRQALKDLKIAVSVDERDEEQLLKQGMEEESDFEEVIVAKHIRLGTVDIFQGQEAKIVIVSLVRNTGNFDTTSAPIGFLKSSNRINVALSRAKHGLFIMGNASNLRKNATWATIIDDLETQQLIGPGLPIICARHPEQINIVGKPGELNRYAPEGGCLLPCGYQLACGHVCPSVCHNISDNHRSMFCPMPCNKTPCPRSHPCPKKCSADCGHCEFPIYNIELPCGHVEEKFPCYLLERLEDANCKKPVSKRLPQCEHSATMKCSKDPALFVCKEICTVTMDCCSNTCKSRCSDCQKVTLAQGTNFSKATESQRVAAVQIMRTGHQKHRCTRPLYCLHACDIDCHSKDIQCNLSCRKSCRQECHHHKCTQNCSTPCSPCMKACIWKCDHKTCPVKCGSICTRLPCDEPCKNTLQCGHLCTSVCGEPCNEKMCIACIPIEKKQEIVDLILQRRLEEIVYTSGQVTDRLITLKCGHIFTVGTLDEHCRMSEFYEIDEMGKYLATRVPPTAYQKPPTCPTCRGPITSLRYGRVIKRSNLDILEQNVASTMSRSLRDLGSAVAIVAALLDSFKGKVKMIPTDTGNMKAIARDSIKKAIDIPTEPLSLNRMLDLSAMISIHGFSPGEAREWDSIIEPILETYAAAHEIATTRGAHVKAYEGAFKTLYRLELEAIATDKTVSPEALALQAVKKNIGQPPPKADTRFQIEAYLHTLELRFMLADLGFARIEGPRLMATDEAGIRHRDQWISFVEFIYDSCIADSEKALAIAQKSAASRQAARCNILIVRSNLERFRFRTIMAVEALTMADPNYETDRTKLAESVSDAKLGMNNDLLDLRNQYIGSRPIQNRADMSKESRWFDDNCLPKVQRFLQELSDLEEFVMKGGGYKPLSLSEMKDIVKAFKSFRTTGRFYNCENGHPTVIMECGGAMESSNCPECGAANWWSESHTS